jgi:hypothetical protein
MPLAFMSGKYYAQTCQREPIEKMIFISRTNDGRDEENYKRQQSEKNEGFFMLDSRFILPIPAI